MENKMKATLNRDDIEKISIGFAKKAYPGMTIPQVHYIGLESYFENGAIVFDIGISSAIDDGSMPSRVRIKAQIQITDLEIPGAKEHND